MQESNTWLVAGLGNPGAKYEMNWHNCGYMVLDLLSLRHKIKINRVRFKSLAGRGKIGQAGCLLLKPTTYMNLSGEAVQAALAWHKMEPGRCLVIYDDIDLPFGQIRIRSGGGPGTHNGMRSITSQLGRNDFPRLRIGIGPKPVDRDIADYVLSDVPAARRDDFSKVISYAADAVEILVNQGLELAMSRYNGEADINQE